VIAAPVKCYGHLQYIPGTIFYAKTTALTALHNYMNFAAGDFHPVVIKGHPPVSHLKLQADTKLWVRRKGGEEWLRPENADGGRVKYIIRYLLDYGFKALRDPSMAWLPCTSKSNNIDFS